MLAPAGAQTQHDDKAVFKTFTSADDCSTAFIKGKLDQGATSASCLGFSMKPVESQQSRINHVSKEGPIFKPAGRTMRSSSSVGPIDTSQCPTAYELTIYDRFHWCDYGELVFREGNVGDPFLGYAKATVVFEGTAQRTQDRFSVRGWGKATEADGTGKGVVPDAENGCAGACSVVSENVPPEQRFWSSIGHTVDFSSSYTSAVADGQMRSNMVPDVVVTATGSTGPISLHYRDLFPKVRCDQRAVAPLDSPGCVFQDYLPAWDVSESRYPEYWKHLNDAQNSGLPNTLTRTDKAGNKANRKVACTNPPKVAGKQCDEYPPASTVQGAASHPNPRSFAGCHFDKYLDFTKGPNGYSMCMIDETQNRRAGSDLASFYSKNRILVGDRFLVDFTS